MIKLQSVTT